ncbi:hypothetical protein IFM89_034100 [Coptis chinensis]|uniref:RanBP2-type domain-containing protein n=1 Tax=Coptis chinensis TaxID=261450 RepID=A0A835I744_9MAGN|nr:hypothetical protein IFM89_034100 [Coptis chinensis]
MASSRQTEKAKMELSSLTQAKYRGKLYLKNELIFAKQVIDTKQQTSYIHKQSKKGAPVDGNSTHVKLKLLFQDNRTGNSTQDTKNEILEAPFPPLLKKSMPWLPAFQVEEKEEQRRCAWKAWQQNGDWMCPNTCCSNVNFAFRGVCNRCGSAHPIGRPRCRAAGSRKRSWWWCLLLAADDDDSGGRGHQFGALTGLFGPNDWPCPMYDYFLGFKTCTIFFVIKMASSCTNNSKLHFGVAT